MRRTTIPSETTAFVDGRIVRTNELRLPSRDLHSHVYFAPILGMLISNSTADSARFREALHWLQITADSGWPQYPTMERDRMLDPVRRDPAVARFLAALKLTFEYHQREFGTD